MQRQQGISLLEVLLSLSIIAIILVMATQYFFVASNTDKINTTRQQVGSIIAAVQSWKAENPEYTPNLNYQMLYDAGFMAQSKFLSAHGSRSGLQMYDPWGQPIMVHATNMGVTITVMLPKQSDCIALQTSYPQATCQVSSGGGGALFNLTVS